MRAAVLTEVGKELVIDDVEPVALDPHDVSVQVEASGVCHSDVSVATQDVGLALPLPLIMGHEGAGLVLEVGSSVTSVRPGDRVVASLCPVCGVCFHCVRGETNLCERNADYWGTPRATRIDGAPMFAMAGLGTFGEAMIVHESELVKIETDLPSEELALLGCGVTTGVGAALWTANVASGSTVAVIGCGGVGQSVIQGARIAGASWIFAVDPVELKRETAGRLGATHLIDPADGDPVEQIRQATEGRGADYAFDVAGLPETSLQALGIARRGGTVVLVGIPSATVSVSIPTAAFITDEKRILGCLYGSAQVRRDIPALVRLIESGRLDVASLVSRRIRLDQVNDAFEAMLRGEVIRSVIIS
jgi:S-(hydroxymethyl)glutathione dehydrogenase / alcohol dehydrogenase